MSVRKSYAGAANALHGEAPRRQEYRITPFAFGQGEYGAREQFGVDER